MQLVGMLPVSHKLSYKPESIWSVLLSKFTALQNITREMTVENPGRILWRQFYSERVEQKKIYVETFETDAYSHIIIFHFLQLYNHSLFCGDFISKRAYQSDQYTGKFCCVYSMRISLGQHADLWW